MTRRTDSGSRSSPRLVEPVTSAKTTVTVFLTSRAFGACVTSFEPHERQKRASGGFCVLHCGHSGTAEAYDDDRTGSSVGRSAAGGRAHARWPPSPPPERRNTGRRHACLYLKAPYKAPFPPHVRRGSSCP